MKTPSTICHPQHSHLSVAPPRPRNRPSIRGDVCCADLAVGQASVALASKMYLKYLFFWRLRSTRLNRVYPITTAARGQIAENEQSDPSVDVSKRSFCGILHGVMIVSTQRLDYADWRDHPDGYGRCPAKTRIVFGQDSGFVGRDVQLCVICWNSNTAKLHHC